MLKQTASCRRRSFFFSSSHSERKGSQESKREGKVEKGESLFMSCRERMEDTFFYRRQNASAGSPKAATLLVPLYVMYASQIRERENRKREREEAKAPLQSIQDTVTVRNV